MHLQIRKVGLDPISKQPLAKMETWRRVFLLIFENDEGIFGNRCERVNL